MPDGLHANMGVRSTSALIGEVGCFIIDTTCTGEKKTSCGIPIATIDEMAVKPMKAFDRIVL